MATIDLAINGKKRSVDAEPDTPLLWVLRDELQLVGIGNAFFGKMTFTDGKPDKTNFDAYRMIRMSEAPKKIDVHFVPREVAPTGLGEPPFPPVFGAVANAIYKATGARRYQQPFLEEN
nr:hypothetical protein [Neolewinella aurantiaca]